MKRLVGPFLVVTLNGMKDFDLSAEIIGQILHQLTHDGLDTTAVESLRTRFTVALRFTQSFYEPLRQGVH